MSFWNKIFATFAVSALFAAPALADGTPGQRVNRGPAPVQAHQPMPPEPGCYLIEDGKAWSCPARPQKAAVTRTSGHATTHYGHRTQDHLTQTPCAAERRTHNGKPCNTFTRTHVKTHAPVVTKRTVTHRSAPTTRTVTHRATREVQRVQTSSEVRLDMASFGGGVGNGVGGDFYGGGGAVIIGGGRSYSGVLSHAASSFTFRSNRRGGKKRGGRGGGCGCMGGGMGGGD